MVVTLIGLIGNLLGIITRMHQLHKAGLDRRAVDEIGDAVDNLHSKVSSYHDKIVKGEKNEN